MEDGHPACCSWDIQRLEKCDTINEMACQGVLTFVGGQPFSSRQRQDVYGACEINNPRSRIAYAI
jgi:hypothetical protein